MTSPWPFLMWGIVAIGMINSKTSRGHRFFLMAIDLFYQMGGKRRFHKVEKDTSDDLHHRQHHLSIWFLPIHYNAKNFNNETMDALPTQFKIRHQNLQTQNEWSRTGDKKYHAKDDRNISRLT